MKKGEVFYLPGLNGIRAIAALLVVLSHISMQIGDLGFPELGTINMAGHGVTMFFVLSGYLITLLLLKEYNEVGRINKKKFYIRRILRIWPIYYVAILIAVVYYFATNQSIEASGLIYYIFLLANVPFVFGGAITSIVHLWSVGVEEQFYLFWPWLFKWYTKLPYIMLGIIIFFLLLRFTLRLTENGVWYTFVGATRFHCMAIGGLGAWAVYRNLKQVKIVYNKFLQIVAWCILTISIYSPLHFFSIIGAELYALLFLIIIINVSRNPKTIIRLENKILNWLGTISYGIYVYHWFAILITFFLVKKFIPILPGMQIIVYAMVLTLTLFFAHISYKYFELRFIKLKNKFALIKSTNNKSLIAHKND